MADDPLRVAAIPVLGVIPAGTTATSFTTLSITCGTSVLSIPEKPLVQIPPAEHPVYRLIGRVAAAWSHLEHTLDLIIWDLAGAGPDKGACITAQMLGATNRYRTIISLLKQRALPQKMVDATDKLMSLSYGPQEERNRIIHDAWYVYDDQTSQFRAMPTKTRDSGFVR